MNNQFVLRLTFVLGALLSSGCQSPPPAPRFPARDTPATAKQIEREIEAHLRSNTWPAAVCYDLSATGSFVSVGKSPSNERRRMTAAVFVDVGLLVPAGPMVLPNMVNSDWADWYAVSDLGKRYLRVNGFCFGTVSAVKVMALGPPRYRTGEVVREVSYSYTVSEMPDFTQLPRFRDALHPPANGLNTDSIIVTRYGDIWGFPEFHVMET